MRGRMARKVRIQHLGAIYHVMNRGDPREAIFEDDEDRERWLGDEAETGDKAQWQVHVRQLRAQTTISSARDAARLNMGGRGHLP